MIYLDTVALVKLVRVEPESAALVGWLAERSTEPLVSSALVEAELPRALRRTQPEVLGVAASVLTRLYRVEITATVRAGAGRYPDPSLRTVDAIHLATAEVLVASGGQVTFVTYDKRLRLAADRAGLVVAAPGAD